MMMTGGHCAICLDSMIDTESAGMLLDETDSVACVHRFHPACILKWSVMGRGKCPLCNVDFYSIGNASDGSLIAALPPPSKHLRRDASREESSSAAPSRSRRRSDRLLNVCNKRSKILKGYAAERINRVIDRLERNDKRKRQRQSGKRRLRRRIRKKKQTATSRVPPPTSSGSSGDAASTAGLGPASPGN